MDWQPTAVECPYCAHIVYEQSVSCIVYSIYCIGVSMYRCIGVSVYRCIGVQCVSVCSV
jgi:hypothetical protein